MNDVNVKLGQKVRDEISGFTGIVNTIGDHITGCTRIGVKPTGGEKTNRRGDEEFFYEAQLTTVDDETEWTEYGERALTETDFELGERVRDTVTGFEGVVLVINYSLFNCPTLGVQPAGDDVDENPDVEWFDAPRLESVDDAFVGEFDGVQHSENMEATGSVTDSAPRLDQP